MTRDQADGLRAVARGQLALVHHAPPVETAYDHVANACQMLLLVEAALDKLDLLGGYDAEIRNAVRSCEARLFKALFLLGAGAQKGAG